MPHICRIEVWNAANLMVLTSSATNRVELGLIGWKLLIIDSGYNYRQQD
jgi:hypothetical protein